MLGYRAALEEISAAALLATCNGAPHTSTFLRRLMRQSFIEGLQHHFRHPYPVELLKSRSDEDVAITYSQCWAAELGTPDMLDGRHYSFARVDHKDDASTYVIPFPEGGAELQAAAQSNAQAIADRLDITPLVLYAAINAGMSYGDPDSQWWPADGPWPEERFAVAQKWLAENRDSAGFLETLEYMRPRWELFEKYRLAKESRTK